MRRTAWDTWTSSWPFSTRRSDIDSPAVSISAWTSCTASCAAWMVSRSDSESACSNRARSLSLAAQCSARSWSSMYAAWSGSMRLRSSSSDSSVSLAALSAASSSLSSAVMEPTWRLRWISRSETVAISTWQLLSRSATAPSSRNRASRPSRATAASSSSCTRLCLVSGDRLLEGDEIGAVLGGAVADLGEPVVDRSRLGVERGDGGLEAADLLAQRVVLAGERGDALRELERVLLRRRRAPPRPRRRRPRPRRDCASRSCCSPCSSLMRRLRASTPSASASCVPMVTLPVGHTTVPSGVAKRAAPRVFAAASTAASRSGTTNTSPSRRLDGGAMRGRRTRAGRRVVGRGPWRVAARSASVDGDERELAFDDAGDALGDRGGRRGRSRRARRRGPSPAAARRGPRGPWEP